MRSAACTCASIAGDAARAAVYYYLLAHPREATPAAAACELHVRTTPVPPTPVVSRCPMRAGAPPRPRRFCTRPGPIRDGREDHRRASPRSLSRPPCSAHSDPCSWPLRDLCFPRHRVVRPQLLAEVRFGKYGVHLPLKWQSEIHEREGVELDFHVGRLGRHIGCDTDAAE